MSDIFTHESELRNRGVSFDTGTLFGPKGPREWHTDWSLGGPMTVEDISSYLTEEGVPHTLVVVVKHNEDE